MLANIPCCNCTTKMAEVWCTDCQNNGYCSECYQTVHKMQAFKDHQPCQPRPPKIIYCTTHPEREVEYWSPENRKIYCSNCLADKQDTHKCELITDAIKVIAERVS